MSTDELFFGVNITGTDPKWDQSHYILKCDFTLHSKGVMIAGYGQEATILTFRNQGSDGTFYTAKEKQMVVEEHHVKMDVRVYYRGVK